LRIFVICNIASILDKQDVTPWISLDFGFQKAKGNFLVFWTPTVMRSSSNTFCFRV